jgi:uncharacterized membrane protein YphA (DoxX/SURF4 family)
MPAAGAAGAARETAPTPASPWKPATRVAFRFTFTYLLLWSVANQVLGGMVLTPFGQLPALGRVWPMSAITQWVAAHVWQVEAPFIAGNSGDTMFYWVQTSWLLGFSMLATAVWTFTDTRVEYDRLHRWFRLFLRWGLAAQMFFFGFAKVIPTQFVPPALTTIVQPIGNMPLSNLLWVFIGASTPYQMATGWAELLGAILLIFPVTTPLGAAITLFDMLQVNLLNVAYDFGLKQISFHYVLMSLAILAPDVKRIANVLLLNREAGLSTQVPIFRTPTAERRALAAQVAIGIYLAIMFGWLQVRQWDAPDGPAHPRSPLYGIWDIERLTIDGESRPVELNDYDRRWRRAIFDFPDRMAFQRIDDTLARYDTQFDLDRMTLVLRKLNSRNWISAFRYQRPSDDRMIFDGTMDGHDVHMELTLVGRDTWPLLNSRFRWVRPPD